MIAAILNYQYMQHAFLAGLVASAVCGVIGVIIVEKRLVMMSGGIAHTAYGGVGLGYFLGFPPIIGAFIFSVLSAIIVGRVQRKGGARSEVLIGLLWSAGMALGVFFIALAPGYPPDVSSYLFGNILTVTREDLFVSAVITAIVLAAVITLYSSIKAYLFDDEFAFITGVNTAFINYLILVLTAMTVVAMLRVVGIILVLALLTAPAASAALFARKLHTRMITAVALGVFFCTGGLLISYYFNVASGAAIVLLSVTFYFAAFLIKSFFLKRRGLAGGNGA